MADLVITIKRSDVYEEVAKTTAYIGAKNKLEDGNINWKLTLSSRFNTKMEPSIIRSSTSYLVNSIIGKWCEITANDKVKEYADNAAALLLDIKEKAFFKKKPTRTKIS